MIAHLVAALLALADTAAARPDSAARRVDPPWWELRADASAESFTSRLAAWRHHTLSLQRRAAWGALGAEAFVARRFERTERGVGADGAAVVWHGAYVDAHVATSRNALVIPRLDAAVELFQSVGHGWEVAPGARLMRFSNADVGVYSFAVGRSVGDWYLRARGSAAPQDGQVGASGALVVRRYFGNATDLVEAAASDGREVVTLAPGVAELRVARGASVRAQRMLTATVGASAALSVTDEAGLPVRRGGELGLFVRW